MLWSSVGVRDALSDSLDICPVSHRERATEPPQFLFLVRRFYFGGTRCGVSGVGATAFGRGIPEMGRAMSVHPLLLRAPIVVIVFDLREGRRHANAIAQSIKGAIMALR
jgi:hypothetical protein